MSDLISDIKARVTIQDLIGRKHELMRAGGSKMVAKEHESLTCDTRKQVWSWWSQGGGGAQKVIGGDVISWVAYQRFGRTAVDGPPFQECLKELCSLAGIEYEEKGDAKQKSERAARAALDREKRDVMARYMDVARAVWTPMAKAQIRQRKQWLTDAIIERWGIGLAPSFRECTDAGISEKELRLCRLLLDGRESAYMHFKDCVVIPWEDSGEITYINSRRLTDVAPDGTLLDKNKKSLGMYGPDKGGVRQPCAFNLNTLSQTKELVIVEGALDAIACEERGHAAIALGCKAPTDELVKRLVYYPGVTLYLALDGTDDVSAVERAEAAGALGMYTRVCELPAEKDPDDLAGDELSMIKQSSIDAIGAWCQLVA